jgi:hypothetical protein
VDPRAGLDDLEKIKLLTLPGLKRPDVGIFLNSKVVISAEPKKYRSCAISYVDGAV